MDLSVLIRIRSQETDMAELKHLSKEAIPDALDKAVRYRLLNEPDQAESICLDVLEIEPNNQKALINLVLALADQLEQRLSAANEATEVIKRLDDDYNRAYYSGIVCERRARAILRLNTPGCHHTAYDWYQQALQQYEKAIELRSPGNDEAILRWNTCVRALDRNPRLEPAPADTFEPFLE
jgi:tetratricopeptide (TPR) repeat protein